MTNISNSNCYQQRTPSLVKLVTVARCRLKFEIGYVCVVLNDNSHCRISRPFHALDIFSSRQGCPRLSGLHRFAMSLSNHLYSSREDQIPTVNILSPARGSSQNGISNPCASRRPSSFTSSCQISLTLDSKMSLLQVQVIA